MSADAKRSRARELAASQLAAGDAVGWFELLYAEAAGDTQKVPWADLHANRNLVEWLGREKVSGEGAPVLVVGCGLGDDAELLAERGFRVTAFDISPTAVDWCRRRFPQSTVSYEVHDLLRPPADWTAAFDFVFEAYTLQVLPPALREQAMTRVADVMRPGGALLVICRGREPEDPQGQMPWPLVRDELAVLERAGLVVAGFEDFWDRHEEPAVRRFRACYRRPGR